MRYRTTIRTAVDQQYVLVKESNEVQARIQSPIGEINISLYNDNGVDRLMIVVFDKRDIMYPSRLLYMGPFEKLLDVNNTLLEHMMFEHAQKLLIGNAA